MKKMIAMALLLGMMMSLPGNAQESVDEKKLVVGLRTNLLTWTLGAPSIGVDVRFAQHWQVGVDVAYSDCVTDNDNPTVRIQTLGLQARRYFRPFGTHHVGQDLDGDGVAYTSDSRGWFVGLDARSTHFTDQFFTSNDGTHGDISAVGLVGGYSFTLSRCGKKGHWGVDALMGLGFIHKDYERYEWYEPVQMFRTTGSNVNNKFGLTTLELSLTYNF